ncbi:MAG: tRNA/rRNA methyltransferase [Chlamydiae bacterium]|nr:tRNA/rRNA methyltransferase [Chlamydiota bacterium]
MKEAKYYGIHACQTLVKTRQKDIIRVYLDSTNVKAFGPLLKWCAENRKAYHIVPSSDLDRITDSVHHEGVCILAKEVSILTDLPKNLPSKCQLLYLDQIENPHNLGAILRTASHFGVPYVFGEKLSLPPSAYRIAKGGGEQVKLVSLKETQNLSRLIKLGFHLIATSSHRGESLYKVTFPPRVIFVFGSESKGVRPSLFKQAHTLIQIPGTNQVESLNVSVAASLCMGEFFRQHG